MLSNFKRSDLRLHFSLSPTLVVCVIPKRIPNNEFSPGDLSNKFVCVCVRALCIVAVARLLFLVLYLPMMYKEYWNKSSQLAQKRNQERKWKLRNSIAWRHGTNTTNFTWSPATYCILHTFQVSCYLFRRRKLNFNTISVCPKNTGWSAGQQTAFIVPFAIYDKSISFIHKHGWNTVYTSNGYIVACWTLNIYFHSSINQPKNWSKLNQ